MQQQPFKVSIVQAAPVLGETDQTIEKLAAFTADAVRDGAKLVVFPEAFVGGYPKGKQFGTSLGIRTPEGREEFRRYSDGAIEVPGTHTQRLGEIAMASGVYLVVGVIERELGTLYCTALFFGPNGQLL